MDNGGAIYIEGANVGNDHEGTDFFDYLGCDFIDNGSSNIISQLMGIDGTFSAPNQFDYPFGTYADYSIDELGAGDGTLFLNSQDGIGRAVYYDAGDYRTISASTILGAMRNGEGSSTRASMMSRYLDFLTNTEEPDIWADSEFSFDIQFVDYPITSEFSIQNLGFEELTIDSIEIDGDHFTIDATPPYTLETGEELNLPITFAASEIGFYMSTLTIGSDDPDENPIETDVMAGCLNPPQIEIYDDQISITIEDGNPATEIITLENTGESELYYDVRLVEIEERQEGGPDIYGYKWKDSDEPEGAVYQWNDIWETGINTGLYGDELCTQIELPFDFPFYGESKNVVYVNSNGFISFSPEYNPENEQIPSDTAPNGFIAPFWDDLSGIQYPQNSHYYYDEENQKFIIQYTDWMFASGAGDLTFQVHLHENGDIYFYYQQMTGDLSSATIGIESGNASDGLQIAYNTDYIEDEFAIKISSAPFWLEADPISGMIDQNNSEDVTLTFDPDGLVEGVYEANAVITTNDPAQPEIIVPITLYVGDGAGIHEQDLTTVPNTRLYANYPNPFNPKTTIRYSLAKKADVSINIYDSMGRLIKTLINDTQAAGYHSVIWSGKDDAGNSVSSGVYVYKINTGNYRATKRMILLR